GRCLPEAMFNGTPVIGRNTGGTREQMDNGVRRTGREIALRYTTTEELVQCLVQAAQGFGAEEEMRKSAFEVVNMLYSDEAYVDNVFRFYEDITRENQERRTR
ncbi:MAG: glycosyl transferase family 1, partial [Bacteroidaceae bacterium]|nr:glycosyl transferase family 1 [Bacteroidaceae bacterium]